MSTVTVPYGLEMPTGIEKISVPLLNRNFQKINDALKAGSAEIVTVNSTFNTSNFDARQSTFTRIRIGTLGVVIASLSITSKAAFTLTSPTLTDIGAIAPAGYRFNKQQGIQLCVGSGLGTNFQVQMSMNELGVVSFRKFLEGNATQWATGTTVSAVFADLWNGTL